MKKEKTTTKVDGAKSWALQRISLLKNGIRRYTYWMNWSDIKYYGWSRIVAWFHRANTGYSYLDSINGREHICKVIAGVLRELQKNAHGYPSTLVEESMCRKKPERYDIEGLEHWKHWLGVKAAWFEWYANEEAHLSLDGSESPERVMQVISEFEKKEKYFLEEVLPDFSRYFGHLWD